MTPHETTFAKLQRLPVAMLPTVDRLIDQLLDQWLDSVEDADAPKSLEINQPPNLQDLLCWFEAVDRLEITPQAVSARCEQEDEFGDALIEKYRKLGLDL